VCITESGWRPIPGFWANDINISAGKNECSITVERHIKPAVSVPVRRAFDAAKTNRLGYGLRSSEAHVSAEEATANYQKGPERLLECRENGAEATRKLSYGDNRAYPRGGSSSMLEQRATLRWRTRAVPHGKGTSLQIIN